MGEALGGHGKRRRNIAPNTGPAGRGLGVDPSGSPILLEDARPSGLDCTL